MREQSQLLQEFYAKGKLKDCPVYDLHGHMGPWNVVHLHRTDTEAMIKAMDCCGVKMLVFCHFAALFAPDIGNSASIESVRKFPERLRVYCVINPNYPEITKKDIEIFDQYPDVYIGFKFHGDTHRCPITDSRYQPALELAEQKELLVLLHTWGGGIYNGPEQIRKVAEKYPKAKIILGHSCHGEWDKAISLVKDFPNIYLDLCAVIDDRGILEKFVEKSGSEKMVFGTDFPEFNHHYYIGAVLGAGITDEDRRNIFYRNAEKLLALT